LRTQRIKTMALNACELELDLFSRGLRLPAGDDLAMRVAADGGLEVAIPAAPLPKREIYVNVPVVEPFAIRSPFRLARLASRDYVIVDDRDAGLYPVRVPNAPPWLAWLTSNDRPMREVATRHGAQMHIRLQSLTSIDDVVETCWAAKSESAVTFVELESGGSPETTGVMASCLAAIKRDVGMLVGVHLGLDVQHRTCAALIAAGVDQFSFTAGRHGLEALAHCARALTPGAVSAEVIAGGAPLTSVMEAIDRIAAAGALPTLRIARPPSLILKTALPTTQDLRRMMRHVYEACRRHWLPIGAAPSRESSLVVDPDDAVLLAPRDAGFYCYEAFRLWRGLSGAPARWKRMRAA
jgi:hypothetical protein